MQLACATRSPSTSLRVPRQPNSTHLDLTTYLASRHSPRTSCSFRLANSQRLKPVRSSPPRRADPSLVPYNSLPSDRPVRLLPTSTLFPPTSLVSSARVFPLDRSTQVYLESPSSRLLSSHRVRSTIHLISQLLWASPLNATLLPVAAQSLPDSLRRPLSLPVFAAPLQFRSTGLLVSPPSTPISLRSTSLLPAIHLPAYRLLHSSPLPNRSLQIHSDRSILFVRYYARFRSVPSRSTNHRASLSHRGFSVPLDESPSLRPGSLDSKQLRSVLADCSSQLVTTPSNSCSHRLTKKEQDSAKYLR